MPKLHKIRVPYTCMTSAYGTRMFQLSDCTHSRASIAQA